MKEFILKRLKQEGKEIILPGGMKARETAEAKMFEEAEKRIDKFWARKKREVHT